MSAVSVAAAGGGAVVLLGESVVVGVVDVASAGAPAACSVEMSVWSWAC
ncbi:hypothetical protein ACFVH4_17840 [Nocardia ignorata]